MNSHVNQVKRHGVIFSETERAFATADSTVRKSVRQLLQILAATEDTQIWRSLREVGVPQSLLENRRREVSDSK